MLWVYKLDCLSEVNKVILLDLKKKKKKKKKEREEEEEKTKNKNKNKIKIAKNFGANSRLLVDTPPTPHTK